MTLPLFVFCWILVIASGIAAVVLFVLAVDDYTDSHGYGLGCGGAALVTVAAAIALGAGGTCNTNRGNGEKVGSIVKLAKTGLICQTWEGQLVRGGLSDGTGVAGTIPFDFTVQDEALVTRLREAMEVNREIKLVYRTDLFAWCASDSNNHFAVEAVPLTAK